MTGVKLVNDLDLIVTNLTTGDVYVGNNMQGNFTQTSGTNGLDLALVGDRVNNVENIYIRDRSARTTRSLFTRGA